MERPPRAPVERQDEATGEDRAEPAVRCPYCRATLAHDTLAAACATCGTLHHAACFAEHRGCSTHGCGSSRARSVTVGAPPPPDFPLMKCQLCQHPCAADEIVARCRACGTAQHVRCYEPLGRCAYASCRSADVELLTHPAAAAARGLAIGGAGATTGAVVLALLAALAAGARALGRAVSGDLLVAWAVVVLLGVVLLAAGLREWLRARALSKRPLARPERAAPGKPGEDATK